MSWKTLTLIPLCLALSTILAGAADWTGFRGPDGSGVSSEKGLPTTWSDTENVVWKTDLPGPGSSSPITSGDHVFITCYTGYGIPGEKGGDQEDLQRHLLCLDRKKGTILWKKSIKAKLPEAKYNPPYITLHGYASSTPATDGERVYVFFGKTGVFAFDFKGNEVWKADVGSRTHGWGSATSPILYKDLVIVNASVESGSLVALNKKDGSNAWKAEGVGGTWDSPALVTNKDGKQEVVLRGTRALLALEPATGKKAWTAGKFGDGYVCPTPVAKDGIVYSLGGRFQGRNLAVKAGDDSAEELWVGKGPGGSICSPSVFGGHLYWVSDNGMAHCLKAKTGDKVFSSRLPSSGTLYASITIADGKIYAVSREKGTFVLAAKPEYELLATNVFKSDKSVFNGCPAVSNGQLLIRSDKCIYCLGKK
jgi:outer membrane protein assembly factor BamB